jgi:hypothetical protein
MEEETGSGQISALRSLLTTHVDRPEALNRKSLLAICVMLDPFLEAPHPPRIRAKAAKVRDLFVVLFDQRNGDRGIDPRTAWKLNVSILQFCAAVLRLDHRKPTKLRPNPNAPDSRPALPC